MHTYILPTVACKATIANYVHQFTMYIYKGNRLGNHFSFHLKAQILGAITGNKDKAVNCV